MDNSIVKDWEKYCKEIEGFYEDNNIPLLGQLQEIKNNIFIAKTFDGKGNENIIEFKNCKPFKTSILNEYIKK